jgi:uncharacterized sulfatase
MKSLLLTLLAALTLSATAADQPNIVFLISDDHAWIDYGFMGHPQIETPNLDKLAARSALFSRGYVPTALCRPALATFTTGLYAHQSKITGNDPAPLAPAASPDTSKAKGKGKAKAKGAKADTPEYAALREKLISHYYEQPSIIKLLGDKGYLRHQSGKWWEGDPKRAGFTESMTRGFPNPGGRHGDDGLKIGREGLDPVLTFIDNATAQKKPFFIWYAPMMPHSPHTPPDHLFQKYKAKGIQSDHVARYYAMVEWFDQTCGQLMDKIEAKGLTENTLFVYIADNGWIPLADKPAVDFERSKQSPFDGGVRTPIFVSWPGHIKPTVMAEAASAVDILPTLLKLAGVPLPADGDGLDLLDDAALRARPFVAGQNSTHDILELGRPAASLRYRWLVAGDLKLIVSSGLKTGGTQQGSSDATEPPRLFDLKADPGELRDLAAARPEDVKRLTALLDGWWTGR